jgi:anti-anti-sigma factor
MDIDGHEIGPAPLEFDRSGDGCGRVCLTVAGELDISNLERLREAVTGILAEPGTSALVLDFDPLDFIDSSGVQILIWAKRIADSRGIGLRVTNTHGRVHRVLTILGVHEVLTAAAQPRP